MATLTEKAKKEIFFNEIREKFGSKIADLVERLGYQDLDLVFFIIRALEEEAKKKLNNLELDLILALDLLENHRFLELLYEALKNPAKNLDQTLNNIFVNTAQIALAKNLISLIRKEFFAYKKDQNHLIKNLSNQFTNSEEKTSDLSEQLLQALEFKLNFLMQSFLQRMMQQERENLPQPPLYGHKESTAYQSSDLTFLQYLQQEMLTHWTQKSQKSTLAY